MQAYDLVREHRQRCYDYFFNNLTKSDRFLVLSITSTEPEALRRVSMDELLSRIDKRLVKVCFPPYRAEAFVYPGDSPPHLVVFTQEAYSTDTDSVRVEFLPDGKVSVTKSRIEYEEDSSKYELR